MITSRQLLRIKVTPDLQLTYSKNGGNLGLVLKMKNIACLSVLLIKRVTKWIKSCLLQCFGTFKMPILLFISTLVFRPEGQIWNPVRRDTKKTFLSGPHLCFIIVFICDLFVSYDDPLTS